MSKAVIFATGGTIACKAGSGGTGFKPALTGEDLVNIVPGIRDITNFEIVNYSQIPGADFSFSMLLNLAKEIKKALNRSDVDGAVVSQGTDSIEEVAYFLDLVVDSEKPVVVTGAMRTPGSPGFDGPANLFDSLVLVKSGEARGMGTMVVMNGGIHAARFVTKSNTTHPGAFKSRDGGILGQIVENRAYIFVKLCRTKTVPLIEKSIGDIDRIRVMLLKIPLDPGSEMLDCLASSVDGIVLEAMGGGHVPSCLLKPICRACQNNIPVVITSRCGSGPILRETYSFAGSEQSLKESGAVLSSLPALKARIKLLILLCSGSDFACIGDLFAEN